MRDVYKSLLVPAGEVASGTSRTKCRLVGWRVQKFFGSNAPGADRGLVCGLQQIRAGGKVAELG